MATQARSIASLTISFGLVAIPVKLYSATVSSERISFNLLRQKDGSRVKQQYIAVNDGTPVERSEMVKGYEFAKDQYVMFSPEELKALEDATTHAIDIGQFVPLDSVDPIFFDGTYYLAPDKGGAKPYTLFASVLRETQRCAVGRWATRGREYVVILRPMGNALALHQLHFAPEVLPISELEIEETKIKDVELKLAQQLVEQQTSERFEPTAYTDEVKARIEAAIQRKVEGEQITLAEAPPAADGKVIDLMEALRASLKRNTTTTTARVEPVKLGERKPPKRVVKKTAATRKASGR